MSKDYNKFASGGKVISSQSSNKLVLKPLVNERPQTAPSRSLRSSLTIYADSNDPQSPHIQLERSDISISVVHCCQCETHKRTTSHVEQSYVERANALLGCLVEFVHGCNLNARVGVLRSPIVSSRHIGSFEVFVSVKSHTREDKEIQLFSKRRNLRWPSHGSCLKKLKEFLVKCRIPLAEKEVNDDVEGEFSNLKTIANIVQWCFDAREDKISSRIYGFNDEDERRKTALNLHPLSGITELPPGAKTLFGINDTTTTSDDLWKSLTWSLQVFLSSTFTDTQSERNLILQEIYPKLRESGYSNGIDVAFSDMRWGMRDENTAEHMTWEIQRCKDSSSDLFFISLQSEKYGYCPLPRTIPLSVLNDKLANLPPKLKELAAQWYLPDYNSIPPSYVLKNLSNVKETDKVYWDEVLPELRKALSGILLEDGVLAVGHSVTEAEVRLALLPSAHSSAPNRVSEWVHRKLTDISPTILSDLDPKWEFVDCREPDSERITAFNDLISWMNTQTTALNKKELRLNLEDYKLKNGSYVTYLKKLKDHLDRVLKKSLKCVQSERSKWVKDGNGAGIPGEYLGESLLHARWAREVASDFTGLTQLIRKAMKLLASPRKQSDMVVRRYRGISLAVVGPEGCGKTAFIAALIAELQKQNDCKKRPIIFRFCCISPDSTNVVSMVRHLCFQIHYTIGKDFDEQSVPTEYAAAVDHFQFLIRNFPIILIIDGLEMLAREDAAPEFNPFALLKGLKPHPDARFVLSATANSSSTSNSTLTNEFYQHLKADEVPIVVLDNQFIGDSASAIIRNMLERKNRSVTQAQLNYALEKISVEPSALYIRLSTFIMESWKSSTVIGDQASDLCQLAPGIRPLIHQLLDSSFATKYGRNIFTSAAAFITFSRYGLTENELLDLLSLCPEVMAEMNQYHQTARVPRHVWVRIRHALGSLLVEGEGGCLNWYFSQFREVATTLHTPEERKSIHVKLAHYFGDTVDPHLIEEKQILRQPLLFKTADVDDDGNPVTLVNRRRNHEAAYHMIKGNLIAEAVNEVCNASSIYASARTNHMSSQLSEMKRLSAILKGNDTRLEEYLKWMMEIGLRELDAGCTIVIIQNVLNYTDSGVYPTVYQDLQRLITMLYQRIEGPDVKGLIGNYQKQFGRDEVKGIFHDCRVNAQCLEFLLEQLYLIPPEELNVDLGNRMFEFKTVVVTPYHSTICSSCSTLCHEKCSVDRISIPGSNQFLGCMAFNGKSNCSQCIGKCSFLVHYHDNKKIEITQKALLPILDELKGKINQGLPDDLDSDVEMVTDNLTSVSSSIEALMQLQVSRLRACCKAIVSVANFSETELLTELNVMLGQVEQENKILKAQAAVNLGNVFESEIRDITRDWADGKK